MSQEHREGALGSGGGSPFIGMTLVPDARGSRSLHAHARPGSPAATPSEATRNEGGCCLTVTRHQLSAPRSPEPLPCCKQLCRALARARTEICCNCTSLHSARRVPARRQDASTGAVPGASPRCHELQSELHLHTAELRFPSIRNTNTFHLFPPPVL